MPTDKTSVLRSLARQLEAQGGGRIPGLIDQICIRPEIHRL